MTATLGTSNLVAVEPGAIREDTPPGSVMRAQASGHLAGLDFDLA